MSLMMLAMGGKRAPVPYAKTFTMNEPWTAPGGVSKLTKAIGHGAVGKDGKSTYVQSWSAESRSVTRKADGSTSSYHLSNFSGTGATPGNSCDPYSAPDASGNRSTICYYYTNTSHYETITPDTRGASATGFGKVFPGSLGSGTPADVTFLDVPITPGTPYQVVVPPGGSITITWMA